MNRSLLMKATSAEDAPTPGYLYNEIAKMTEDGVDVMEKVVRFLVDRLKRKEPAVKLKVLIIIKHVCRRGSSGFRRAMHGGSSNMAAIKECLQFTGPADPLKGDQPYRAVREAAKEALEAIFDNSRDVTPSNSALAARIQGYGGNPAPESGSDEYSSAAASPNGYLATSGYGGGGRALPSESVSYGGAASMGGGGSGAGSAMSFTTPSGSKYGGIGNPNFRDPRNQPKGFLDRVKDRVEVYTDKASKTVATSGIQEWLGSKTSKANGGGSDATSGFQNASLSSAGSYQGASSMGGAPSGFAVPASTARWGAASGSSGGGGVIGQRSAFSNDPRSPRAASAASAGAARSDGTYERGLVDDLCARGGVRAVPAKEKLTSFLSACKTLDASVVMPIVYEKLSSSDWKVQHKALCVCEALVQGGDDSEAYVDYIDEHADVLEGLQASGHPTVRNRCKKVWVLLYGTDAAPEDDHQPDRLGEPVGGTATRGEAQGASDLLGFGDETESAVASVPPLAPAAAPASPATGLFGELQVKQAAPTAAAMGSAGTGSASEDLLFGDGVVEDSSAASGELAGQFSGLMVDSGADAASAQPAAMSGSSGTAFSFLQGASGSSPAPMQQERKDNASDALDALFTGEPSNSKQSPPTGFGFEPKSGGVANQQTHLTPQQAAAKALRELQNGNVGGFNGALSPQQQQMQQMQMQMQMMQMQMMQNPQLMMQMQQQMQQQMMMQPNAGQPVYGGMMPIGQPMKQPAGPARSGPGPAPGAVGKISSSKAAKQQPDKFDFVSSAMAEMK